MEIKRIEGMKIYKGRVTNVQIYDILCMKCFNHQNRQIRSYRKIQIRPDGRVGSRLYINNKNGYIYEYYGNSNHPLHSYNSFDCPCCGYKNSSYAIDIGMIGIISLLNMKGYSTNFSCEGHSRKNFKPKLKRGRTQITYGTPYIKFHDDIVEDFIRGLERIDLTRVNELMPKFIVRRGSIYGNKFHDNKTLNDKVNQLLGMYLIAINIPFRKELYK